MTSSRPDALLVASFWGPTLRFLLALGCGAEGHIEVFRTVSREFVPFLA